MGAKRRHSWKLKNWATRVAITRSIAYPWLVGHRVSTTCNDAHAILVKSITVSMWFEASVFWHVPNIWSGMLAKSHCCQPIWPTWHWRNSWKRRLLFRVVNQTPSPGTRYRTTQRSTKIRQPMGDGLRIPRELVIIIAAPVGKSLHTVIDISHMFAKIATVLLYYV